MTQPKLQKVAQLATSEYGTRYETGSGSSRTDPLRDLDTVHPPPPDTSAAVRALPAAVLPDPARLLRLPDRVQEVMSGFSDALPCQLIHRDEDGEHDNVLVDGARLSAVVDFEFAGPDQRVLEVAIPLVYWPIPDDEQGRWAT